MKQGKCKRCKKRFLWSDRGLLLRDAYCPYCGHKLAATSCQSLLPVEEIDRPLRLVELYMR